MKQAVYDINAKKVADIELPESIFNLDWNPNLVHQVIVSMMANARLPFAHTKDRGEVSGGGKKPWKQKGLGRARHGSIRSPIWMGGGVAHGPRNNKKYSKKINKKMRQKALFVALSRKLKDNEILFVNSMEFSEPKTSQARKYIESLSKIDNFDTLVNKKYNAALIVTPNDNILIKKSFNNFGNIDIMQVSRLNPVEVLRYKRIIFVEPESSIKVLESKKIVKNK